MFLSNGAGFNAPAVIWDSGPGNYEWPRAMLQPGDFNGDGRQDVATLYNYPGGQSKFIVFLGDGAGHLTAPSVVAWDSGPGNWEWDRTKLGAADLNGDGKTDMVALYNYPGGRTGFFSFVSTGAAFNPPTLLWDSGLGNFEWPRADLLTGDFSGDGKPDIGVLYDYTGQTKFWLYTGTGQNSTNLPSAPAWDSGPGNWDGGHNLPFVGDYNADGKIDFGTFYVYGNAQVKVMLFTSAGATVAPAVRWDSGLGNWEWGHVMVS